MTKLATITINGREQFFSFGNDNNGKFVIQVSGDSRQEHWMDFDFLASAAAGHSYIVPSKEYPSEYSFDLNQFAKMFGIQGRWKNESAWGHTHAKHSTSGARFIAYDGIER
jgi:hypothetical protein